MLTIDRDAVAAEYLSLAIRVGRNRCRRAGKPWLADEAESVVLVTLARCLVEWRPEVYPSFVAFLVPRVRSDLYGMLRPWLGLQGVDHVVAGGGRANGTFERVADHRLTPEEATIQVEDRTALQRAIRSLDRDAAKLIRLRYPLGGVPVGKRPSPCQSLGHSPQTLAIAERRALATLRGCLETAG